MNFFEISSFHILGIEVLVLLKNRRDLDYAFFFLFKGVVVKCIQNKHKSWIKYS